MAASGTDGEDSPPSSPVEAWRGCSMHEIYRGLNAFELDHVPAVRPSDKHTVLHHCPINEPATVPPRPHKAPHKWDAQHVRLPCSSKSQYPVTADDGTSTIESRWEMIEKALLQPIKNSREFQAAVLAYNSKYQGQWNFKGLHRLFEEELDESEVAVFFDDLLPRIIRLALRLPELLQAPIPLLRQGQNHSITLTQQQISCLLANAFLCTFPRRNTLKKGSEYSSFSDINFNHLFQTHSRHTLEKIKCICHYFRRVCPTERDSANVPTGVVTFTRRSVERSELPNWAECEAPLGATPLHITAEGTIEDQGFGLLQVDFANKFIGGGVLRGGCVQEEIRFVICPELLISKLFTEFMLPNEALIMVGAERYSNYSGYANTFQWAGNHEDSTPRDSSRRRLTHVVAIDAVRFTQKHQQYRDEFMLRELNKAYIGFLHTLPTLAPGVASGNWGCGAFGGDAMLKALLQLVACTANKRPLVYYTFGNAELRDQVHRIHTYFIEHNVRVKDLWVTLTRFEGQHLASKELYNFLYSCLGNEQKRRPTEQMKPTTSSKLRPQSSTDSEPDTSKKTAIGVKQSSTSCQRKNISRDIFASSTESESDAERKVPSPISVASSDSDERLCTKAAKIIVNSESTVDLCTPEDANEEVTKAEKLVLATQQTPKHKIAPKTAISSSKKRAEPRQRTLLEMLNENYGKDESTKPATKRFCVERK